jgi:Uma2 family endonuclease
MSIADRSSAPTRLFENRLIPPLQNGDRLTRREFERRYEAMPNSLAELIEGVVFTSSPVSLVHSEAHSDVMQWLGAYRIATPNLRQSDNVTFRIDTDNEFQPDVVLWLDPAHGGRAHAGEEYLEGSPELIFEVAVTSASRDLHLKKNVYRRAKVQEYVVWQVYERRVDWFELKDEEYMLLAPDENGIIKSSVFPGLWLTISDLLEGDLAKVLVTLQKGLATEAYTKFVEKLKE